MFSFFRVSKSSADTAQLGRFQETLPRKIPLWKEVVTPFPVYLSLLLVALIEILEYIWRLYHILIYLNYIYCNDAWLQYLPPLGCAQRILLRIFISKKVDHPNVAARPIRCCCVFSHGSGVFFYSLVNLLVLLDSRIIGCIFKPTCDIEHVSGKQTCQWLVVVSWNDKIQPVHKHTLWLVVYEFTLRGETLRNLRG